MPTSPCNWREQAWNGLRFEAPSNWEPVRIGPRYLLFEDGAGPVMEIKWEPVRGKFSHAAQLKRLSTAHNRKKRHSVATADLPPKWASALDGFEAMGFSWGGDDLAGRGAILYCPGCRQASLVQFFRLGQGLRHQDVLRILSSFRDHGAGGWEAWSLFDIKARIPDPFQLAHHRFAAGHFELVFGFKHQKLCLHRWAPARVLLNQIGLTGFARDRIGFPGGDPAACMWEGHPALEWGVAPSSAPGARWWGRFKAKHPYKWLRLWHLEGENRILGVRFEGNRPLDPKILDEVCAAYEVV